MEIPEKEVVLVFIIQVNPLGISLKTDEFQWL